MNINPDDPKWTAYVLGEMEESDRAAVELELESSAEAREFVEELRLAATFMKERLPAEMGLGLAPEQRTTVRAAAGRRRKPSLSWSSMPAAPTVWAAGLAAASLLVAAMLVPALLRSRQAAQFAAPKTELTASVTAQMPESALQQPQQQSSADLTSASKRAAAAGPVPAPRSPAGEPPQVGLLHNARREFDSGLKTENTPTENQVRDLPVNGRDFANLVPSKEKQLQAGQQGQHDEQGQQRRQAAEYSRVGRAAGADGTIGRIASGSGGAEPLAGRPGVLAGVVGGVLRASVEAVPPPPPPPPATVMPSVLADRTDRIVPLPQPNANGYDQITDNPFIAVSQEPLATFSSDVDTASYANVRRFLNQNQLPPKDAVRIEELINYFSYEYPQASGPNPITGNLEVAAAPWNPQHRLVRVGIKAKDAQMGQKPSNLVFLIDVSGSMSTPERLPLLKSGLRLLVDRLTESDKVSVVTYAGASGVALQPTSGDRKDDIMRVIEGLQAQGSTNGGAGIQTAYEMAVANFIRGGVNRVILATDGDFNIGITNQNDLVRLIEDKAKSGVFLTVLGVGNNFKDSTLVKLANKGHGNYAYIDGLNEARKVLVEQMGSTLVTVAKDVKIQVEFNPAKVNAYRLIGYENRVLRGQDFNNDQKDAGDMGAGHTVTALFEVVPPGVEVNLPGVEPLRYTLQPQPPARDASVSNEMLNLKIRYKDPEGSESRLLSVPLVDRGGSFPNASADFRFAAAVAGFGMILRDSPYTGTANIEWVIATAANSRGPDKNGYRQEFVGLAQHAGLIKGR